MKTDDVESDDSDAETSPTTKATKEEEASPLRSFTYGEGQQEISFRKDFNQLVATAVVSSFTAYNCRSNPAVPTIWINKESYRICIYDCINDILLLSRPTRITSKGTISRHGLLIMWLIVYHR